MFNWKKISKEDRAYIECLNKKLDEQEENAEKVSVEEHSTRGAYSGFLYLSGHLNYDKDTVIESGGVIRDMAVIDNKNSCILTISYDNCEEYDEQLIPWIKERISMLVNNIPYKKKEKDLCSWSIGRYFNFEYKHDNRIFTPSSISIELINVPHEEIVNFAKDLCCAFTYKTVFMKDYAGMTVRFLKHTYIPYITVEMAKEAEEEAKKYLIKNNNQDNK